MERKQDGGAQTPEILREELPMQRFEGQKTSQAVVEGEVALPGGHAVLRAGKIYAVGKLR